MQRRSGGAAGRRATQRLEADTERRALHDGGIVRRERSPRNLRRVLDQSQRLWHAAGLLRRRDLNGDGFTDLIVAEWGEAANRLVALPGGRVPADAPAPYLPADFACALHDGTRPDLATDADLIRRSTAIRWADFAPDACELAEACVAAPGSSPSVTAMASPTPAWPTGCGTASPAPPPCPAG